MEKLDLFFQDLIEIFDLKMWNRHLEALEKINEAFLRYTGMDRERPLGMAQEILIQELQGDNHTIENYMIASHLTKQLADISFLEGKTQDADDLFQKSFRLFMEVYRANPEFDFSKHVTILYELENRVPVDAITSEYEHFIDNIYERTAEQ